ncbi:PH domain-containing protein [Afipia birgiae]|jgi:uncharacterized membrane protein YdbT with pleckstrin-like domain|uniref:PH domain-containing protein n=1 Tax=Afipia birgiae TaxID=151414 RepID=UPI00037B4388|nr:PH domain-containing protein [Afipia birgiae]
MSSETFEILMSGNSGEAELLKFHPSTGRYLIGTITGWLIVAGCLFYGIGLPILLFVWIQNRCTKYTITNQRIKIQEGIIFRTSDEIELYRIKDVKVHYSILNQLFDIGIVTLLSSDPTTKHQSLRMFYVQKARDIRETVRNLVEQSRRRRGVREVDVDPMPYQ